MSTTQRNSTWRDDALCRGADPAAYFPLSYSVDRRTNPNAAEVQAVLDMCNSLCPVADACRNWAMETNQSDGIFGGTTPDERRRIRRRTRDRAYRKRIAG